MAFVFFTDCLSNPARIENLVAVCSVDENCQFWGVNVTMYAKSSAYFAVIEAPRLNIWLTGDHPV